VTELCGMWKSIVCAQEVLGMFFVAEMALKVIAYGFILNPGASPRC
jgi:hypothetical protein